MAYGESFRTYPTFDDQEVFELTGHSQSVIRLEPNHFEGPVAQWANDRIRKFGETIVPRQVYVEQPPYKRPHRVAWIYHEGRNTETGQEFSMHHVACDCSGDIENANSPQERQEIVDNCPGLVPVLAKQADLVNADYAINQIMEGLPYYQKEPMEEQTPKVQEFVARSILYLLEHDYRHPESWIANIENGWTLTNLMADVLKVKQNDIDWVTSEILEPEGSITVEGVVISLSQRLKDTIHAERVLREITSGQSEQLAA